MSLELLEGMMANNVPLTEERNARYTCISLLPTEIRSLLKLEWGSSVFLALVAHFGV